MIIFLFRGFVGDGFILPVAGIYQPINQSIMVLYAVQNLSKKMGIMTSRSCFSRIIVVRPNFLGQNIVTFASVFFNFNLEQNFYKNFSRSYHEEFHPPRVPGKDDITGSFYNLGLSFETENTFILSHIYEH